MGEEAARPSGSSFGRGGWLFDALVVSDSTGVDVVDEDKENGGAAEDPADGARGVVRKYCRPVEGLTRGDPRVGSGSAIGVPGTCSAPWCSAALTWTPRSPATLASWAPAAAPAWGRMLVKKPSSLSSESSLPHGDGPGGSSAP